ncbi:hypothetical protein F5X68DRAFT_270158 [Plectosphaerella plurivora]|uniref:Dilute domain-containing protein n=1 Tax=Plectosphaerella plurivora TaxID=936078 RepID=A0A9P9A9M6_9PEZI|nr:hypothetical protein F5X68DRAFT_270158 [Plectosphaerella plurivora]
MAAQEYKLESIEATRIASDDIDTTFRSSNIDLISGTLGGKILAFSDEWFAEAANLLTPTPPIRQPGKMVFTGAWYDGWETRRHNTEPFDWVIVRLGVASGTVEGIEVDTAFFNGNHAPSISVEGCFSQDDADVISWKGGRGKWETILGNEECGPSQRFGWKLKVPTTKQYTHVRLNMYPDGGIARFRLFGHAVPVFPDDKEAIFDLAAAQNGGVAVSCSDQHFGTKDNLLLPGRGKDMGDGWETARSRSPGHVDWAIIRLGAPGYVQKLIVKVEAISWEGSSEPTADAEGWKEIVAPSKCGPDQEHEFESGLKDAVVTHVKIVIIPDGGVKRLRTCPPAYHARQGQAGQGSRRILSPCARGSGAPQLAPPCITMDFGDPNDGNGERPPRQLPADLPKSLDDRKSRPVDLVQETEMYDGWQGQSQFLTSPILAKPLSFNDLSLDDDRGYEDDVGRGSASSDARLMEMLAAQAAHQATPGLDDEETILANEKLSETEKKDALQKTLNMAASNGDVERVTKLLSGNAKAMIDINALDEDGTPPLIYASCFGHEGVVQALIDAGVDVDRQDRNQWSALMWAMTNRHKGIAKTLLDNGASPEQKTSSGRTAFDFVPPDSEMSFYLHDSGYNIGNAGTDDFYNPGFSQDRFEEEMAENEMRRRMMMDSARDLEVDLGNVGMDDQPEEHDEFEEEQPEFDWTRCLHDQMFVFQEHELDRILDIIITNMRPQRSPTQKPVPANMIFLSARYAHYHASPDLLAKLLISAMDKINDVVEEYQWDMTILAFWISNATLLLHYLKKDAGLMQATGEFQAQLAELVNEIFILIVRDAERRLDKVIDPAMLDHETIPGFENITFQNEWRIFKRKTQVKEEPMEKRFRPPSPKQKAKPAPRNVTSLLSSTLFVLDLYDIHSVITAQIVAQLLYWIGAELFNRIMSNRKYLARTKAMQIRMNISTLEDWARSNNRQPEHYEGGEMNSTGETTVEAARRHLAPVIQLLQWLQCFSSLDQDDLEALVGTLQQLKRLSPQQLIHAAQHYRPEVGEKGLPKSALKYINAIMQEQTRRREEERRQSRAVSPNPNSSAPVTPVKGKAQNGSAAETTPGGHQSVLTPVAREHEDDEDDAPEHLLLDPALMLPFSLPSVTDMLVSYGAGFGGLNRERERKYIPTVPQEFLTKLEASGARKGPMFSEKDWENEEV